MVNKVVKKRENSVSCLLIIVSHSISRLPRGKGGESGCTPIWYKNNVCNKRALILAKSKLSMYKINSIKNKDISCQC